jgi:hypothetical protein
MDVFDIIDKTFLVMIIEPLLAYSVFWSVGLVET